MLHGAVLGDLQIIKKYVKYFKTYSLNTILIKVQKKKSPLYIFRQVFENHFRLAN